MTRTTTDDRWDGAGTVSDDRLERMQVEFLERHKDADLLEFSKKKHCICAIYFSPKEKWVEAPLREFFRAVLIEQERRDAQPIGGGI